MKKAKNYINNRTLYESMIDHKNKIEESIKNNKTKPEISKYIGESIYLICNNLAKKPNFSGYTYKQEMIGDALVDCIAAVDNFDPNKTKNPFAYFTQIAWNAFIRRIQKEKKQTYVKHKNFENSFMMQELMSDKMQQLQLKTNEYSEDIIRNFEKGLTKNKKPSKLSGIEVFSEELK